MFKIDFMQKLILFIHPYFLEARRFPKITIKPFEITNFTRLIDTISISQSAHILRENFR